MDRNYPQTDFILCSAYSWGLPATLFSGAGNIRNPPSSALWVVLGLPAPIANLNNMW